MMVGYVLVGLFKCSTHGIGPLALRRLRHVSYVPPVSHWKYSGGTEAFKSSHVRFATFREAPVFEKPSVPYSSVVQWNILSRRKLNLIHQDQKFRKTCT
jgi:hypothetical protein